MSHPGNPIDFSIGEWVQDMYTGQIYRIDKHRSHNGISSLVPVNVQGEGEPENWNSCNNCRFISVKEIDN